MKQDILNKEFATTRELVDYYFSTYQQNKLHTLRQREDANNDMIDVIINDSASDKAQIHSLRLQKLLAEKIKIKKEFINLNALDFGIEIIERIKIHPEKENRKILIIKYLIKNYKLFTKTEIKKIDTSTQIKENFIDHIKYIVRRCQNINMDRILQDRFGSTDLSLLYDEELTNLISIMREQLPEHQKEFDDTVREMQEAKQKAKKDMKESQQKERNAFGTLVSYMADDLDTSKEERNAVMSAKEALFHSELERTEQLEAVSMEKLQTNLELKVKQAQKTKNQELPSTQKSQAQSVQQKRRNRHVNKKEGRIV